MPRVAGVDPGTLTIDICVLDDGRLAAERSWSTAQAVGEPETVAGCSRSGRRWSPDHPGTGSR
jgi:hypothetical protein